MPPLHPDQTLRARALALIFPQRLAPSRPSPPFRICIHPPLHRTKTAPQRRPPREPYFWRNRVILNTPDLPRLALGVKLM